MHTQTFFYGTTQSSVGGVNMEEPHVWRASYKLYTNFLLHGGLVPLTPTLSEGQLYVFLND